MKGNIDLSLTHLYDKDGNFRFIEGNGRPVTMTGLTVTYCKWSLSGTNLMIMCIINLDGGVTLESNVDILYFEFPQWILDKIYPITSTNLVNRINALRVNTSGSGTPTTTAETIYKTSTGIKITNYNKITTTNETNIVIQFDLLIDND